MAHRNDPILPGLPQPPHELSLPWARQIHRWLEVLSDQRKYATGTLRGGGLFLTDLDNTGYGLKVGEVFSNAGILTIVREGDIWIGSQYITSQLGSVTVTTA